MQTREHDRQREPGNTGHCVLLEDVWQNGKKVIPANTLVHGTARAGRMRDRVTASGAWHFVWQDGREITFNGVALDREYEQDIDGYGITDGSAGIKGRLMATDDLQELKMLASAALSGFARGTQDRTQTRSARRSPARCPTACAKASASVFDLYAKRTLKDIEENGYFVRVAAGKEFYVYVLESVDPQKASLAGVKLRTTLPPLRNRVRRNLHCRTQQKDEMRHLDFDSRLLLVGWLRDAADRRARPATGH
jgi:hypothetical protein